MNDQSWRYSSMAMPRADTSSFPGAFAVNSAAPEALGTYIGNAVWVMAPMMRPVDRLAEAPRATDRILNGDS